MSEIQQILGNLEEKKTRNNSYPKTSHQTETISNQLVTKNGKDIKMADDYKTVIKLIQYIPIFSGTRSPKLTEEVNVFLKACSDIYTNLTKLQQPLFLNLIGNRFRGDAFFLAARKKFNNFEELQDCLKKHYIPIKSPADVKYEISMLKQLPTESILRFAERLQSLTTTAKELLQAKYKDEDAAILAIPYREVEEQAIKTFKNGIRDPQIRTALMTQTANSLDSLIETTLGIEQAYVPSSGIFSQNIHAVETHTPTTKLEEMIYDMRATLDNIIHEKKQINTQNYAPKCEFCRNIGHTINVCRNLQNSLFCDNCHTKGHAKYNCTKLGNTNRSNVQRNFPINRYNSDRNYFKPNQHYKSQSHYNSNNNINNYQRKGVNYRQESNNISKQQYKPKNYFQNSQPRQDNRAINNISQVSEIPKVSPTVGSQIDSGSGN